MTLRASTYLSLPTSFSHNKFNCLQSNEASSFNKPVHAKDLSADTPLVPFIEERLSTTVVDSSTFERIRTALSHLPNGPTLSAILTTATQNELDAIAMLHNEQLIDLGTTRFPTYYSSSCSAIEYLIDYGFPNHCHTRSLFNSSLRQEEVELPQKIQYLLQLNVPIVENKNHESISRGDAQVDGMVFRHSHGGESGI